MNTPDNGSRPMAAASAGPTARTPRPGKKPGPGVAVSGSQEALRLAAGVLEVLCGLRSPQEAAAALGLSVGRYYQVESQAVRGLVRGLEPRPHGRAAAPARAVEALRRDNERLQREVQRQQALVRLARQAAGGQ